MLDIYSLDFIDTLELIAPIDLEEEKAEIEEIEILEYQFF